MHESRLFAAIALAVAAGCGGSSDSTSPPTVDVVGSYVLQSIGGERMPVVVQQDATTAITIVSDDLTVADSGTWSESSRLETSSGPQTSSQVGHDNGTWTLSGNALVLFSTQNGRTSYTGIARGNELDLVVGSTGTLPFVFAR